MNFISAAVILDLPFAFIPRVYYHHHHHHHQYYFTISQNFNGFNTL